jgi:predicted N-formylglutamate amidohydrolase
MDTPQPRLLGETDPPTYTVLREYGSSPFVLICDHAGNRLPRRLGSLGLPDFELERHIAWDIGAAGVTRLLSERLDAFAILQTYSRLAIDCNRKPGVSTSIAVKSEDTEIPGNRSLSAAEIAARVEEIFTPYHDRIVAELDRRGRSGIPIVLVSVHSFTPVYRGVKRPWDVGLLYNRDDRMARQMMALLRAEGGLTVGDNEPYSISDESDYAIPIHGEKRGLHHAEIEIRQDLIADAAGQAAWADRIARILTASAKAVGV